MPTYEQIFGPTYDQIENYPEEYLEKKIRYPIKRSKDPRFGEQTKNRIDQIIEEPKRIGKNNAAQSDFAAAGEPANQLKKSNSAQDKAHNPIEATAAVTEKRQQQIGVSELIGKTKPRMPAASSKINKSGDNTI